MIISSAAIILFRAVLGRIAKQCSDICQIHRLLALAALYEGMNRMDAVTRQVRMAEESQIRRYQGKSGLLNPRQDPFPTQNYTSYQAAKVGLLQVSR